MRLLVKICHVVFDSTNARAFERSAPVSEYMYSVMHGTGQIVVGMAGSDCPTCFMLLAPLRLWFEQSNIWLFAGCWIAHNDFHLP